MVITYVYGDNLYVNTTNRCDMNCAFCLRHTGSGVGTGSDLWLEREPTKEEILADIRTRDLSQYAEVVFCGYGEPSYRLKDIVWVIDQLKAADPTPKIRMDTNGHSDLIWKEDTVPLFRGRFDILSISLNGDSPESYALRCRPAFGEKSYEAMLDFTRRAVRAVPRVIMTVVDYHMTKEEIDRCRTICEDLGAEYRVRAYSTEW